MSAPFLGVPPILIRDYGLQDIQFCDTALVGCGQHFFVCQDLVPAWLCCEAHLFADARGYCDPRQRRLPTSPFLFVSAVIIFPKLLVCHGIIASALPSVVVLMTSIF